MYHLLRNDTLRFGQLKKVLPGITNTVLANTLKKFERAGVVNRIQFNEIPPHVEYSLTELGKLLLGVFYELAKWGDNVERERMKKRNPLR